MEGLATHYLQTPVPINPLDHFIIDYSNIRYLLNSLIFFYRPWPSLFICWTPPCGWDQTRVTSKRVVSPRFRRTITRVCRCRSARVTAGFVRSVMVWTSAGVVQHWWRIGEHGEDGFLSKTNQPGWRRTDGDRWFKFDLLTIVRITF